MKHAGAGRREKKCEEAARLHQLEAVSAAVAAVAAAVTVGYETGLGLGL
jgi:hypothetical protein